MIRYTCPHCQRPTESADALRGFAVICIGCRQSMRVPEESTLPADTPPPPPPPRLNIPDPPPIVRASEPPPAPVADTPTAPVIKSAPPPAPPPPPPKPVAAPRPAATARSSRRWLIRGGLAAVLVALLIVGGSFGLQWYRDRQAAKEEFARKQQLLQLQDRIRENFDAKMLSKLAAKHPTWNFTPDSKVRIKGKLVLLSITDGSENPPGFWDRLLAHWPSPVPTDAALVREILENGKVDDLMFELPDERWAEGVGETDTVIAVRWHRELAGSFRDGKFTPLSDGQESPPRPVALRWRVTILLLDRATSQVTARQEFIGQPPEKPPTGDRPFAIGPKPFDQVRDWLRKAEAGVLKDPTA